MPKKIDYPPRGMDIEEAIRLAKILYDNGKKLKIETFAQLIEMSEKGGAFKTKVNNLIKYGLIEKKDNEVLTTDLTKNIINAYDEEEKQVLTFKAFTTMPLFHKIFEKFKDTGIEFKNLEKILIREFDVNEKSAIPVRKCIENSLSYLGVLNKATGEIKNPEFEEVMALIDNEQAYEEYKEQNQEVLKQEKIVKNPSKLAVTSLLNNDILDLIIILASQLEPMDLPIEAISNIIGDNENLTHAQVALKYIKKSIQNNEQVTPEDLEFLLDAIKRDLRTK